MNTNEASKKFKELRYLNFFSKTELGKKFFKDLAFTDLRKERPDFLFINQRNGKTIGLEITNIIIESKKQKSTATLNSIVRNVCALLTQNTAKKYCVFLGCNDGQYEQINLSARDIRSKIFSKIMQDTELKLGENRTFNIYLSDGNILNIYYCLREDNGHFPGVSDGGIVNLNPFELLRNTIQKKNNNIKEYLKSCDECYLLLVSDNMMGQSSFIEFDETLNPETFKSDFKAIYLYEFGGKIHSKSTLLNTYT